MSEHKIPIPSRIYNAAVGGHVTGADQIIDDNTGLTLDKVAGGALEEKTYISNSNNGMGRVVLRKNIVKGVNTLTQNMINQPNTIYVIQYDFTLGENITVLANCVFKFNGGSISAGDGENMDTITGQETNILCSSTIIFKQGVKLNGSFKGDLNLGWFEDMKDLSDSAYNTLCPIYISGDYTINKPIVLKASTIVHGNAERKNKLSLSSNYNGDIKAIFIFEDNCSRSQIHNVILENGDYGIYSSVGLWTNIFTNIVSYSKTFIAQTATNHGIGIVYFKDIEARSENPNSDIVFIDGDYINQLVFENCWFGGTCKKAININISNASEAHNIFFEKCWFEQISFNSENAIYIGFPNCISSSAGNIVFRDNYFEAISNNNSQADFIKIEAKSYLRNIVFESNRIHNTVVGDIRFKANNFITNVAFINNNNKEISLYFDTQSTSENTIYGNLNPINTFLNDNLSYIESVASIVVNRVRYAISSMKFSRLSITPNGISTFDGNNAIDMNGYPLHIKAQGSNYRPQPTIGLNNTGMQYFDETLGKPIWLKENHTNIVTDFYVKGSEIKYTTNNAAENSNIKFVIRSFSTGYGIPKVFFSKTNTEDGETLEVPMQELNWLNGGASNIAEAYITAPDPLVYPYIRLDGSGWTSASSFLEVYSISYVWVDATGTTV